MAVLVLSACGGDDDADTSSSETSQTEAGASASASAGKSGSGSGSSKAGSSAATAGRTSMTSGASGKSAEVAGKAGSAGGSGRSASMSSGEEDAGVSSNASAAGSGGRPAGAGGTSGQAGSSAGAPAAGGGASTGTVTFKKVYALFQSSCSGATCHVSATRAGDMLAMSDEATAYKSLVNADAVSCPGAKRVVPGDPDKSELVHALKHTALSGCARTPKMPDNQPMLNQTDIDMVVSWIKRGAAE